VHFRSILAAALIFLLGACATTNDAGIDRARSAPNFLPDGGPPVVNGLREERIAIVCPGKHCYDPLIASGGELYAQPKAGAPIVGRLVPGEFVSGVEWIYRMRPIRGVVKQAFEAHLDGQLRTIQPGAVVYIVDARQDVFGPDHQVWFQGFTFTHAVDDGSIEWAFPSVDRKKADEAAGAGEWVKVRRENGQVGFVGRWEVECLAELTEVCAHARPTSRTSLECPAYDISPACRDQRNRAELVEDSYPSPRIFRDCAGCPSMVWIPGQSFAAGQYEVTFAEWDACVAAGGCNGYKPSDEGWGRGIRPVMNVRWADAQAFVQWLSQRTGKRYRLLTTDEWTTAAFPGGRRTNYSWGNAEPGCTPGARNGVAYNVCTPPQTLPVGTFQPNAYGLFDTIGNVGEWLQEPYAPGDPRRAIIGSSWASDLSSLGGRGGGTPTDLGPDTGFRVARDH
jgi:hypothetical protein